MTRFTTFPLILAALMGASCGSEPEPRVRPNIVLITIDSLRQDHLGSYGYDKPTSPTLDRLASEGVRFETALSTTSWTLPSHAALFTGMFDSAHGLVDNGLKLADDHHTLAELMQLEGYRTAGFFGGPYLHPTFGLGQGFDHYQSCMTTLADDLTGGQVRDASRAAVGASHKDVTGPRTVEEVSSWLSSEPSSKSPFFLFVHLWDVHYDYIAPPEYQSQFVDPAYTGAMDGKNFATIVRERRELSQADKDHVVALYDAEIRFTDDIIAKLIAVLEEAGVAEDTLVVVTADHGEEFFEHGGWGHQGSLFDEQVRIPLIFHWKGRLSPRVVSEQARLIDLLPTLLTLAGAKHLPALQGRSLAPALVGASLAPEPALLELLVDGRGVRALREPGWKYMDLGDGRRGGFDLNADPVEQVARTSAHIEQGLEELKSVLARTKQFGAERGSAGTTAIEVSAAMQETLRLLGYSDE